MVTFGATKALRDAGKSAAHELSNIKVTLKLDNVDDVKQMLDSTIYKVDRLLQTAQGDLRETLLEANGQLQDSLRLVDSMVGQRIDQLSEETQRVLLWIAAYTDQVNKMVDDIIRTAGEEVRSTIGYASDNAGQLIRLTSEEAQALVLRASGESQKLIYAVERGADNLVRVTGQLVQDSIQLTGQELRFTVHTAGDEMRSVVMQLSTEARIVLADAEQRIERVIGYTRVAAQQVITDLSKSIYVAEDGVVYIVERTADLLLAVGAALLGVLLLFLAAYGWGRALLQRWLPAQRVWRGVVLGLMVVSFVAALLPFAFLSKAARAAALERPYMTMADQPAGLPGRPGAISAMSKAAINQYEPEIVVRHLDAAGNEPWLTVQGSWPSDVQPTVTYGGYALDVLGLSANEFKVKLSPVYEHPNAAESIRISFPDGVMGAVPVQQETAPPTAVPIAAPASTPTPVVATIQLTSSANIRSGPGTQYEVVGGGKADQVFEVVGTNGSRDWWQISVDGQFGWVSGSLTTAPTGVVEVAAYIPEPPPPTPTVYVPEPTPVPTLMPPPQLYGNINGYFFDNPKGEGAPVLSIASTELAYDWGVDASPGPGVSARKWAARFTASYYVEGGYYTVVVNADDAVAVSVDSALLIDTSALNSPGSPASSSIYLTPGYHNVLVQYWQVTGPAYLYVYLTPAGQPS